MAQRTRQPLPDFLRDAPELYPGLHFTYSSFMLLHSCRSVAMCEGPITYLDMCVYCDHNEIYGTDKDDFIHLISKMDAAYLEWRRENDKKRDKEPENKDEGKKPRGGLGGGFG